MKFSNARLKFLRSRTFFFPPTSRLTFENAVPVVISTKMPKELLEFDMTKPPGASWGIRIGGGVDRGKVLVIEKVQYFFTLVIIVRLVEQ